MDYGFHPPTVYFPLVVPEALMIEPTETEAKETLDAFVEAMLAIAREAREDPEADQDRRRTTGRSAASTRCAPRSSRSSASASSEHVHPDGARRRQLEAQKGADAVRPVPRAAGGALRGDADLRPHVPSLIEEAEAIGWYEQRLSVEKDAEARAIMANAQQEEFKHFAMDLEFLLRRTPKWRIACEEVLFQQGDIVEHGEEAEEAEGKLDG